MGLAEIVHVTVSAQDAAPSQASFEKILLAAYHTAWPELIRDYTDFTAFQTDFEDWPALIAMGAAFFGQSPHPVTVAVGRLTVARSKIVTVTPTVANNTLYTLRINAETYQYTSDSDATAAEIVDGLQDAIALNPITGVTPSGTSTLILTGDAGVWFSVGVDRPDLLGCVESTSGTDIDDELTAIANERDDWYGVAVEFHSESVANVVADWVKGYRKIYGVSAADPDIAGTSTTDMASDEQSSTNNRAFFMWNPMGDAAEFAEVARMAERFPFNPGGSTYNFKQLAGVTATPVTGTQVTNLKSKNVSVVRRLGGLSIVYGSKMAGGRYIDVQTGIDWFQARIEEGLFTLLAQNPKVPYTEKGFAMIEGVLQAITREAVRNEFLADDDNLSITHLPVADQNATDRANRIARGFKIRGRLAGAVEEMFVEAVVFP